MEEEKKAKEQRDRRLIEQAKKIENLSSLVLNSERDDRSTAFSKVSCHNLFMQSVRVVKGYEQHGCSLLPSPFSL